jgi:ABC-type Mn2+/Zn2+ transport system permease subunit
LVSSDIARTAKIGVAALDLQYLLVFALTVGLGLRYLGVLLMGSLLIIPAVVAKRLARSVNQMLAIAAAVAVFATAAGLGLASALGTATGPLIVLVAAAVFTLSLGLRR